MTETQGTATTIAIAAGIGAATGLLSYLVPEGLDQVGIAKGAAFDWLLRLWPGIVFGAGLGCYVKRAGLAPMWSVLAFVPLVTGAWYTALWFAINGVDKLGFPFKALWQLGIASGLIGAGLVALAAWLLFPFFRNLKLVAGTIAVGGAAGVLLGLGVEGWRLLVLFTLWQAAIAACFGWGVVRAGAAADR
ncbi:MAG: hypothetical protein ACTSUD_11330 [Alphaproteobacteria bacterium]